jgi:hypothetical protein
MIANDLFCKAAAHLAKRPVLVRFRRPVWDFARACAYKTKSGDAVVDITLGLSAEMLFDLTHEADHLKHDWPDMPPTNVWRCDPGSLTYDPRIQALIKALPREERANQQARIWLAYADKYYRRYPAWTELESRLLALADYPMAELLDRVQTLGAAAGKAAALKAYKLRS